MASRRTAQSKLVSRQYGERRTGAYQALRDLIFAGDLGPNERLVEMDLADRLNVSRTPVREALQKLAAEGLVVEARKGYVVAEFSAEFVIDHYAVREVIEGLAARLAAVNASEIELVRMRVELQEMNRASKLNDLDSLARHNIDFYRIIAKASRNVVVDDVLTMLHDRLALLRDFNFRIEGRRREALKEQGELLNAIEARDQDKAERVAKSMSRHARQARLAALGKPIGV